MTAIPPPSSNVSYKGQRRFAQAVGSLQNAVHWKNNQRVIQCFRMRRKMRRSLTQKMQQNTMKIVLRRSATRARQIREECDDFEHILVEFRELRSRRISTEEINK